MVRKTFVILVQLACVITIGHLLWPSAAAHCFVPDFTNCADSICCWSADAKSKLVVRYGVYFYSIANFSLENFSCSVQLTKGSIGRWYLRWFIYFWYENKSLPFSGFRENSILQVVKSSQNTSIRFCAAIFSILFGIPSSPGVLLTSTLLTAFSISLAVTGGIGKSAIVCWNICRGDCCGNSSWTMFAISSGHVGVLAFFPLLYYLNSQMRDVVSLPMPLMQRLQSVAGI